MRGNQSGSCGSIAAAYVSVRYPCAHSVFENGLKGRGLNDTFSKKRLFAISGEYDKR